MKGFVSFHPIDLGFFDDLIAPLIAGKKVNPEAFVADAVRVRRNGWVARRYAVALDQLSQLAEAPKPDPGGNLWQRLKSNIEAIDFKPDEAARLAAKGFDADLHLDGRPFFIAENSAEKVADAVVAFTSAETSEAADAIARAQLGKIDPALPPLVEPAEIPDLGSDLAYRTDLLASLRIAHDLPRLAREGKPWTNGASAVSALPQVLPAHAVVLHGRAHPFWIAKDVDGLETICRAAGVPPPDCLSPAFRPFAEACEAFPSLKESLGLEMRSSPAVGAFVAPAEIGGLVDFLAGHGAKIIGAATRAGEGPMATSLLRKIKECAVYAQKRGLGYLEAAGVLPPERDAVS
ncbi:MAG TPA: hypothetical protein VFV19_04850 [Candidatus Polarisedimenticolaceae bacterium]|nr:hypothetical protein [Candidatus Polarisedimenticolaceae bacterium]